MEMECSGASNALDVGGRIARRQADPGYAVGPRSLWLLNCSQLRA